MNLYRVVSGVLVVGAGQIVRLTKEQASPRLHKLASVDGSDSEFTALEPLQFIVGEELGIADLLIVQQPFVTALAGEGAEPVKPARSRAAR